MESTAVRLRQLPIKAFTLLESLLVLFAVSLVLLSLSGSVQAGFRQVQEQLFFLEFEQLYRETQQLSAAGHEKMSLTISERAVSNVYQELVFPQTLQEHEQQVIHFDQAGGNSSLSKIIFQTEERTVVYQLYMGNGKFKKTENQR
ncbi:Late competence protein ComGD, access of DNA to ComEA [Streptococcus sp. DD11]|uniref:competence type IV pilus minor pilin ComGD n=1 Tax=Streptococcus sp. DD11 TaxID=1777879 RepID=UPI0007950728|nr:competence type IV pilus minor pilin ComGD [Streptococcus sp. DD11]KXT83243.1 Late competence protein ComGD, access of DNA to ComEA [Streptococcus sp. DD11]